MGDLFIPTLKQAGFYVNEIEYVGKYFNFVPRYHFFVYILNIVVIKYLIVNILAISVLNIMTQVAEE